MKWWTKRRGLIDYHENWGEVWIDLIVFCKNWTSEWRPTILWWKPRFSEGFKWYYYDFRFRWLFQFRIQWKRKVDVNLLEENSWQKVLGTIHKTSRRRKLNTVWVCVKEFRHEGRTILMNQWLRYENHGQRWWLRYGYDEKSNTVFIRSQAPVIMPKDPVWARGSNGSAMIDACYGQ